MNVFIVSLFFILFSFFAINSSQYDINNALLLIDSFESFFLHNDLSFSSIITLVVDLYFIQSNYVRIEIKLQQQILSEYENTNLMYFDKNISLKINPNAIDMNECNGLSVRYYSLADYLSSRFNIDYSDNFKINAVIQLNCYQENFLTTTVKPSGTTTTLTSSSLISSKPPGSTTTVSSANTTINTSTYNITESTTKGISIDTTSLISLNSTNFTPNYSLTNEASKEITSGFHTSRLTTISSLPVTTSINSTNTTKKISTTFFPPYTFTITSMPVIPVLNLGLKIRLLLDFINEYYNLNSQRTIKLISNFQNFVS